MGGPFNTIPSSKNSSHNLILKGPRGHIFYVLKSKRARGNKGYETHRVVTYIQDIIDRNKINELSWWSGNALEAKYLASGMKDKPFCTVYTVLLKERKGRWVEEGLFKGFLLIKLCNSM